MIECLRWPAFRYHNNVLKTKAEAEALKEAFAAAEAIAATMKSAEDASAAEAPLATPTVEEKKKKD